ncbi:MAG: tRNA pseudouridine(38-40) synthase TruA [Clostridia bacterium]|nr:tRNA pseudouridine(38-40) synthase TruA [Clostridia bacterium]
MNYLLTMRFCGTAYHGWQRQQNAVSVQEKTENAVLSLFGEKVSVTGCSRTDAGVHANCFKANFKAEKLMDASTVVQGMNFYLPEDVSVLSCEYVGDDFNARFSCVSKEYRYVFYDSRIRDPFLINRAEHVKHELNERLMDAQAKDYLGTHDFSAFCAAGAAVRSNVRTVKNAGVLREDGKVVFFVEADGFLYNMVRIMAGTLLYIDEGKIPEGSIPLIIEKKNRLLAGKTVPAHGLYLNKVFF